MEIVWHEATFADSIQGLLNYGQAFKEDYHIRLVDVCIVDIFEDMMSSKFLASNGRAIHLRNTRVQKISIKHQGMLSLLLKVGMNAPVAKTLSITYLDDPNLYISLKEGILLMIQVADTFEHNLPLST